MPATHRYTSDDIENMIEPVLKMIESNKKGVRQTELEKLLVMSRDDFMKLIKKMVKIKGFSRHQIEKYTNNENYILQYIPVNLQNDVQSDKLEDIEKISIMMVDCYILRHKTIHKQLQKRLTMEFLKSKSIQKLLYQNPEYTKINIMDHAITDERLPSKLKKLENEGALHSNTDCSLYIALYAVNHYEWDGQKNNEKNVIDLATSISKYLQKNKELNQKFVRS